MLEKRNFAWPITAINKYDYLLMERFIDMYRDFLKSKKIIIFGAGIRGTEISIILKDIYHEDILFVDNNKEKWGGYIDDYPIISPEEMLKINTNRVILISTEEYVAIEDQLESYGLVKGKDYFCLHNNQYEMFVDEFSLKNDYSTLIMGDCMFEMIAFDDKQKDSLAEIISDKMGPSNVKLLTMHGMNMLGFYHIMVEQCKQINKPKIFVVMINFETLTGKQHLLPRSQHTKLIDMINTMIQNDSIEFSEYKDLTKSRVENVNAEFFTTNKYTTNNKGNINEKASKLFLKLNYMYNLDLNIEPVRYFVKIIDFCIENNIKLIPFVPPVNYQLGIELFGDKFEERYSRNLEALKLLISEKGFELLDLSHIITKAYFSHSSTPDETVNYEGRQIVADKIVNKINDYLKGAIK